MSIMLILFVLLSWYIGYLVLIRIVPRFPHLLLAAGSFLVGAACVIPIAYIFACIFSSINQPLLWSVGVTDILLVCVSIIYRRRLVMQISFPDVVILVFSFAVSYWLMFKTLHADASGLLFVGSNNIFDFSHMVGLVRSMSLGSNIPFMSPFQSDLLFFYHFFFNFYIAIWEYFGVPLVYAVNILSILSFSSLLVVIYSLPQVFGKNWRAGWIAVLLTLTHPTMTFFKYISEKGISSTALKELWNIPTYLYAGPFDGTAISIFMTLNNYVNQRHLAFGIALGLLLYAIVWYLLKNAKKISSRTSFFFGVLVGLLFYWNMVICGIIPLSIFFLFVLHRQIKKGLIFLFSVGVTCLISLVPFVTNGVASFLFVFRMLSGSASGGSIVTWSGWQFLWANFTILPFIAGIGYITFGKEKRIFIPFIVLFVFVCVLSTCHHRGFDQKLLSFSMVSMNILAGMGLLWIWERKSIVMKACTLVIFSILIVSGGVDLLAIKNEFAYPLISNENISVITWIKQNTAKNAVFISFSDIIDPVVLAGRKNYFGFFGNAGAIDRSFNVGRVYGGDINLARQLHISYILIPKWEKNDFPYIVDNKKLTTNSILVYEDVRYRIYSTVVK